MKREISDPLQENYENLANAIVKQAADDYIAWKFFKFKHPIKKSDDIRWLEDAERFLLSEDLKAFTDVDSDFILNELDKKIPIICAKWELKQMHKAWRELQGFTSKKKGNKKK